MLKHLKEYHELIPQRYANQRAITIDQNAVALKRELNDYVSQGTTPEEREMKRVDYIYTKSFIEKLLRLPVSPHNLLRVVLYVIKPNESDYSQVPSSIKERYIANKKAEFLSDPENVQLYNTMKDMITNPKRFT
jgi:hypothetical protein